MLIWNFVLKLHENVLIAEQVMGWEPWMLPVGLKRDGVSYPWCPSTDIVAAWEVVEKLSGGHHIVLERFSYGWRCDISALSAGKGTGGCRTARAHTAPHAICLAALKAVNL